MEIEVAPHLTSLALSKRIALDSSGASCPSPPLPQRALGVFIYFFISPRVQASWTCVLQQTLIDEDGERELNLPPLPPSQA